MTNLTKLAEQMRKDWDRRVSHDYRFWMSDGYQDDGQMWSTGERDFSIVSDGIPGGDDRTALEIGCGVGRMLRSASKKFGRVVGLDVSQRAIDKARELIGPHPRIELVVGSGFDVQPVESNSIDFVWSYAALTSMPTKVIASYLLEMKRVVKQSGTVRLQVYLGQHMGVSESDTLHLRCYSAGNFKNAVERAGMRVASSRELVLPIPVSFKEYGVEAVVVTLEPTECQPQSAERVAEALLPEGESDVTAEHAPLDLEAWMTLRYAEELADAGEYKRARQALDYVVSHCRSTTIDISDILERILSKTERGGAGTTRPEPILIEGDALIFEQNLRVIEERFPALHAHIVRHEVGPQAALEVRQTSQGPALWRRGSCLDHADKPISAADTWVARSLRETRVEKAASVLLVGFGLGYHVEKFLEKSTKPLSCVEPSIDSLRVALSARDLREALSKIQSLEVGTPPEGLKIDTGMELVVRPQNLALDAKLIERWKGVFYGKRGMSALHPKIGVLGPIQGGTIPTGLYTYNALLRWGQRTRRLDMSGFNDGFNLFDQFLSTDVRKGLMRNSYVEMLSQLLLESFNEKPVDILICMAQAPITPRVLTELRRRGVITVLWFVEDYLRFTYWREMAQFYDFIFTIQKGECLSAIKNAGAGEVHYLPTACDPYLHAPMKLTDEDRKKWGSPVSFVGAGYHNRQQMFASLANYPFKIWGSEWPLCKPFDRMVQEESRRIAPEEYIKIFNATEVNLNLHSSMERDGVEPNGDFLNPRTFELASCGAFQLVDERLLLKEAFDVGTEIVTFKDLPDLRDKIDYYMAHPREREEINQRSRARVLKEHTYDKRIEEMLSVIYASKYEHLRAREEASPWNKMEKRSDKFPELKERCQVAAARGEEPTLDALVSDIVTGKGKLSETEQKLLFLFHVRKQIIRMTREEAGLKG
jgi:spore maturation protein CgeB